MATILHTHGDHPNAVNGQFLPFDNELFADYDEGFLSGSDAWTPLEELAVAFWDDTPDDTRDEDSVYTYNEHDADHEVANHFHDMALEASLNPSDFYMFSREDQEAIIRAWVAATYRAYCKTDSFKPTRANVSQCGCIGMTKVAKLKRPKDFDPGRARQPHDKGHKKQPRVTHMYP